MAYDAPSVMTLAEELEYWKARALYAEGQLIVDEWDVAVAPLTLQETRLMRLLAKREHGVVPDQVRAVFEANGYRRDAGKTLDVVACKCRKKLPAHIAPAYRTPGANLGAPLRVPDRAALKAFLDAGTAT